MSGKKKFLLVGTGRNGSTLLAAIIARSGGNFGLPPVDDWDRRGGALEHPHILASYKWYSRAQRIRESLIPDQAATVCLKLCRGHLKKNLEIADYVKSSRLVWLVDEANRLTESIRVVGIYRRFSGYVVSQQRKSGGDYRELKDMWTNVNGTLLVQAQTYPMGFVSYEELMDPAEIEWARRLHSLTGIATEELLTNRKQLLSPPAAAPEERLEDEATVRLYNALRGAHSG